MEKKKRLKCNETKLLNLFYKNWNMSDGYLNKCIKCVNEDASKRIAKLREDPEWVEKERKRATDKYVRLYRNSAKPYLPRKENNAPYRVRFPEKGKAGGYSQHIVPPKGKRKHHWSYNEEHYKDVIFLTCEEHFKIHRYMIYDQERMMYRSLDGILLDTKKKHLEHYEKTKNQK